MKKKLRAEENELYRRVDEILHYIWDPIGVSDCPKARDEYHSYLPRVFSRLMNEAKDHEIAAYLNKLESCSMGMSPKKDKAFEVASL